MVDQTSQFYAILTQVGAAKQANADALGIPWKITQMAVGDGNPSGLENPPLPMPNASATTLLNEWRRAPLNQLKVDEKNSSIIVAEQVIPADVGGRWIREVALFDADGDMVAVANCAPTFKPLLSQGSGRTQVVRMNLIVSSSSNVELKIDPSVVLATREWVTEELAKQDFKHSVLVATTAAVTLSGLQTVDGVALTAGTRVLVKNQAAAKDNGLYLVVAGGAWLRCVDADTSAKVTPGLLVQVEKGVSNADTVWQLVTDAPITLGVSALAFEMAFGRTGVAAGTYRSVTVDVYGRVVAATNPTTVAGYGLTDVYTKILVDQALALKADLASPTFTGAPKAPTAAAGNRTTQLATTEFVTKAIGDTLPEFLSGASTTDWNTILTPGWFPSILSASAPNSPGASALFYYCEVLKYSANVTQIAYPYGTLSSSETILYRSLFQGSWSNWREFATTNSPAFTGTPTAPTAAAGTSNQQLANTAFVAALGALKANLANPTFTGSVSVPNVAAGDSSQLAANTAFVMSAIAALVSASPAALDTLNELAAALGNDPNFATTITNLLALKAPLASPALTGDPKAPTPVTTDSDVSIATTAFVRNVMARYGVGAASAENVITSIDTINESGSYMVAGTTTGTKPIYPAGQGVGAIPNGTVQHWERGSNNMATQLWDSLIGTTEPVTFLRTRNNSGVWTEWAEIRTVRHGVFMGTQAYKNAGVFTWAVPPGVKKAWVTVIGGGGGGGRSNNAASGSGGGGGGGLAQKLVALDGVSSVTVTVGAGGAGAVAEGTAGDTGATSSFGAYLSATGGVGGMGLTVSGSHAGPGTGGQGAGGDFNTSTGVGHASYAGVGGSGGGAGGRGTQGPANGSVGSGPGGGGSGAYFSYNGGAGAAGIVIIQW